MPFRRNFRGRNGRPSRKRNVRPSGIRSSLFRRRVQPIRNRKTMRPRPSGYNNIALSTFRRLISYPSSGHSPTPGERPPKSSWWLDKLEWFGSIALQLIGVMLTIAQDDDLLKDGSFAITSVGTSIGISAGDLLSTSAISTQGENGECSVPYEQARILWVKAHIVPIVDTSVRGGTYAAAIVPIETHGAIEDVSHDFEVLSLQPGSVIRSITQPVSVSWSPTILEQGLQWYDLNVTQNVNDSPACVLVIGFSDMALNSLDSGGTKSAEYTPKKSSFEVHLEGRVEVRRPGYAVISKKLHYSDSRYVLLKSFGSKKLYRHSDIEWHNHQFGTLKLGALGISEMDYVDIS